MLWKLVDIGAVLLAFGILVILGPGVFVGPWRHLRRRFSQPHEDG
jgi:hypothetical protein